MMAPLWRTTGLDDSCKLTDGKNTFFSAFLVAYIYLFQFVTFTLLEENTSLNL